MMAKSDGSFCVHRLKAAFGVMAKWDGSVGVYLYTCIEREREREKERELEISFTFSLSFYTYIYLCIYIYVYITSEYTYIYIYVYVYVLIYVYMMAKWDNRVCVHPLKATVYICIYVFE